MESVERYDGRTMPRYQRLLSSPLLKVSRLSRKWRKLFIVVASCIFHSRMDRGRKDSMKTRAPIDLRILFVSNVTRLDDDKSYVNHPSYICLLMAFRATNCKISEILMNERYSLRGIELWRDWRVSNNDENSNEL